MSDWSTAFESIGDNCEFGFLLNALGNRESSLLRWAFLDSIKQTAKGIETGFDGVFEFENLKPAGGGTMVRDVTAGIAFHTRMHSVERDGAWVFVAPDEERRRIHADEQRKFAYLKAKFERGLADGRTIYVVKRIDGLVEGDPELLLSAIRTRGNGHLLAVSTSADPRRIGRAELVRPGLARGWIDRFAPHDHADQISRGPWESLLRSALSVFPEPVRPG